VCLLATLGMGTTRAADRYWPPIVDPPTHTWNPGRWVWADLVTSDVAAAADFYGKVFGWTYETYGGDNDLDTYTLVLADKLPIGGMVFDARAMKGKTPSARWIAFVSVDDVARAAASVSSHGGKVVLAPKRLGERGDTAIFQDPEGTLFGAIHAASGDPPNYLADDNEWMWIDLWTGDVARATEFYRAVAGYEQVMPITNDGGGHSGAYLLAGGYARAGIMQKLRPGSSAAWIPYVRVADVRAAAERARTAGGRVLIEPTTLRRAVVAIVADPTGAPIGIAQLDRAGTPQ
jgi:uncharacterized protein